MLTAVSPSRTSTLQGNVVALSPPTAKQFHDLRAPSSATEAAGDDSALYATDRESWTLASPFCNPDF